MNFYLGQFGKENAIATKIDYHFFGYFLIHYSESKQQKLIQNKKYKQLKNIG